jgi:hypothetical protein
LIPGIARHCIQRQGIRRFCSGEKASWKASEAQQDDITLIVIDVV